MDKPEIEDRLGYIRASVGEAEHYAGEGKYDALVGELGVLSNQVDHLARLLREEQIPTSVGD